MEPKKLFWTPSKSGDFSTKSAYWIIQERRLPSNHANIKIAKRIWSLRVHDRFKLLIWRILFDALPTKFRLNQIFPVSNLECPLCDAGCEDSHHLLLECAFTERIWFSSKWKFRLFPFRHLSVSEWFLTITGKDQRFLPPNSTQEEFITFWIAVLDLIWRNRNNILHGKPKMEPDAVARIAHTHTVEHSQAQVLKSLKASSVVFDKWLPPPEGWLKVNTDAAFSDGEGMAACVIRNHEGTIICAKSERIWAHDPTAAEVLALKSAFLILDNAKIDKAIFETDSLLAAAWIKNHLLDVTWQAWQKLLVPKNFGESGLVGELRKFIEVVMRWLIGWPSGQVDLTGVVLSHF
ncbi:UNVERIFIED_CONTAM: hypothetical protein Sangu_2770000 [Sesamum angustifolium]|uniref:Reverse transcriptase zinc-binding domain-containing protein n=1 Tax=Sesamum angustifolium TaxID=2727405 RepID=A0AAW2IW13_9LAMI